MRQQERRRTPYPLTWEPLLAALLVVLVALAIGVHVGRGAALLVAGVGWRWPEPALLFRSLPAVLGGDPSAGLAHPVPPVQGLSLAITVVEVILLAVLTAVGLWAMRRWGPQRLRGVASVAECEALLGRSRLWKARRIIRPDLYPSSQRPGESTE